MKMMVLINPVAGAGKTLRLLPKIRQWLSQSPHQFSITVPRSPEEMRSEIERASTQGFDAILLCGGDGTIHDALPAILKAEIPFGYLPCGRGNDFARNVGLTTDLRKSCRFPQNPSFHRLDLPTINQTPFMSTAYVGFDAEVNRLFNEGKGHFGGALGYTICLLKALKHFKPFTIEARIDGHCLRERVMLVTIANGPYYGGGMKIVPQAIMDDGWLDLCLVKEISKLELLRQFPKIFKGTHITHPQIVTASGKKIKITSDEPREIFSDGEYLGVLPAECTIGSQSLRVLFPDESKEKK